MNVIWRFLIAAVGAWAFAGGMLGSTRVVVSPMSPVEARLIVPDPKLLPGVPADLWIELRNPSSATVGVGLCADMLVEPDVGEPFTIFLGGEEGIEYPTLLSDADGQTVSYFEMRPNSTETLTLPILPSLAGPVYFRDGRLSPPGLYRISIQLDYCWGGYTPQKSLLPVEFLGRLSTNAVTFQRIEPVGIDALVWRRMQEVTDGNWVSVDWTTANGRDGGWTVVGEILTKYRDSAYYPYAVLASTFGSEKGVRRERAVDALARFPQSPVAEWLDIAAWETALPAEYDMRHSKAKSSKRPTTRRQAFGREDLEPAPCSPNHDCVK